MKNYLPQTEIPKNKIEDGKKKPKESLRERKIREDLGVSKSAKVIME